MATDNILTIKFSLRCMCLLLVNILLVQLLSSIGFFAKTFNSKDVLNDLFYACTEAKMKV